jgi:hypothetical protein
MFFYFHLQELNDAVQQLQQGTVKTMGGPWGAMGSGMQS